MARKKAVKTRGSKRSFGRKKVAEAGVDIAGTAADVLDTLPENGRGATKPEVVEGALDSALDTASDIVGQVGETVGDVAETVGGVAGAVIEGVGEILSG